MVNLKQQRDRTVVSEKQAIAERRAAEDARGRERKTALAASKRFAQQAIRAAEAGRWDEAERRTEDAEAVALDTPWSFYARGTFAGLRHDDERAVKLLRKALAVDADHQESQTALAEVLARIGQVADVEKLIANIGKIRDWRTLLKAGRTLYAAGRWRECQAPLKQAGELMQEDKDAPRGLRDQIREETARMTVTAKAEIACEGL